MILAALLLFSTQFQINTQVQETVQLQTMTGVLEGTLLTPSPKTKVPVAVIIAGSGPTDRDGNSGALPGKNDSLKQLAEGLASRGVATVRYDKRGVGKSAQAGASESALRFGMYVDDAVAWIKKLQADQRFSKVVVIGHSEGSLIGMMAAQRAGAAGFVSIAGISRPAGTILREQLQGKLAPELLRESERILTELEAGRTVDNAPPMLAALFRPTVQPYLISWFQVDPAKEMAKLTMPSLVVQGTTDLQTSVADARGLQRANPKAELVLIEGMNHVLKAVEGDLAKQLPSYGDPSLTVVTELVDKVAKFIRAR
ncbi:MAG: alpha/beta hydrolase [Thermoanaerobaculia bacterium]